MTAPTFDQVRELPTEFAQDIPPTYADGNGHVDIWHYFDLHNRAVRQLFERIGVDDVYLAEQRQGVFTMEHHLRYLAELFPGEQVSVHTRVIERSPTVVHAMSFLTNATRGVLANTLELCVGHIDLAERRISPFSAGVAAGIDRELALGRHVPWPPPTCGVMGVRRRGPSGGSPPTGQ